MVRGALSLGGHGGVDQGAASPDLVPGLLLQHARNRLEAEQNLLTVFPVVRRHPRLSLFYIQLVSISKSQKVTLEFHWTWASANMWECWISVRADHQRLSGPTIYLTFSIIGSAQARQTQKFGSQSTSKWIFYGSSIWISSPLDTNAMVSVSGDHH